MAQGLMYKITTEQYKSNLMLQLHFVPYNFVKHEHLFNGIADIIKS